MTAPWEGQRAVVPGGTFCPGLIRTPLWRDMTEADRETTYASTGERLPIGRVGEADDVAEAYLFLMRQGFATCQTFVVDGGGVLV